MTKSIERAIRARALRFSAVAALLLPTIPSSAMAQAPPAGESAAARVVIDRERVETSVGDTVRLQATAYDAAGREVSAPIRWLTSYEVGAVDSTGTFVATGAGEEAILAMAGDSAIASIPVVVAPLAPSRLELRLPGGPLTSSSWVPLEGLAFDRLGNRVWDARFEWTSQDPRVAAVVGGWLEARRPGSARLTARAGDAVGTREITVTAAPRGELGVRAPEAPLRTGEVFSLAPTLGGAPLPAGAFPRFTVTGPDGRVHPDGAFVAEEPGDYVVVARYAGDEATAGLRVLPRSFERELALVGRGAVSYAHTGDLWVFDDAAYLGNFGDNSLRVFDVSDPTNPVATDSIVVDARRVNDVKVNPEGGFAIMTREGASDRRNGIVVLGIDDPHHPTILSEYTETVSGGVHNTFIVGDLVYAVHNGTRDMHIIDVSDRARPREVGRWGIENPNRVLHDVFIKDGIAYLSYWDDGLVILDLGGAGKGGTPTEPVFVSRIAYPQGNTHVAWRWKDYVFVGDEIFPQDWDPEKPVAARGFIHVIDVSDLEHPIEVAKYEVPEAGAHNVWINDHESVLYIGYYQAGLRAVDVSGDLRGDLFRQGRQIDFFLTEDDERVKVPNATFNWGAMTHEGLIYSADFNSGLWVHEWVPVAP
ncbi:MAG: hypothetical protein ABR599_01375 [Gemmatimonadota bacterium]